MTDRTIGDLYFLYVVLLHQLLAEGFLVLGRLIEHVEHFLLRTNVLLDVAVAVDAPSHIERISAPRQWHFINLTVAGDASNPFGDMDAMIEIDKLRDEIHAYPLERFVSLVALTDGRKHRAGIPDLRMAGHTRMCGWETRECTLLNRCVAIPAIDAKS